MLGNGLNSWIYIEIYVIYASVTKNKVFIIYFVFLCFYLIFLQKFEGKKNCFPKMDFKMDYTLAESSEDVVN